MKKMTADVIRGGYKDDAQKLLILRCELDRLGWELWDDGPMYKGYVILEKGDGDEEAG